MTRPTVCSTEAVVGDCWSVQQKARRGSGQKSAKPRNDKASAPADVSPAVVAQPPAATAAHKPLPAKVEASAPKWQHGWGELSAAEMADRTSQLQEMGFSLSAARSALEVCDWDVNRALDSLFLHKVPASTHMGQQDGDDPCTHSTASDSTTASSTSSPRTGFLLSPPQLPPALPRDLVGIAAMPAPALPPMPLLPPVPFTGVNTMLAMPPGIDASVMATKPVVHPLAGARDVAMPRAQNPIAVTAASRVSPVSLAPKRQLAKVAHTWACDTNCSDTQLSIEEGTFVYVWSESKTAEGWIYAESLICSSKAGWLPASMLRQLPPNQRWMRVAKPCHALYPTQMAVEVGNLLLVDVTQTPVGDGWVYVDQLDSAMGHLASDTPGTSGWVPIQCIIWAEV